MNSSTKIGECQSKVRDTYFIGAVKSEILDPQNRNKVKCNIFKEHIEALLKLTQLQKNRVIVIKRSDKGAGTIVLDFTEYMRACNAHLSSKLTLENGSTQNYYTKVNESAHDVAKLKLKNILQEGLDHHIINKQEYDAMDPEGKKPAKLYCTFKVHKPHTENRAPPERPIVSARGSAMENASHFVEHNIKTHGTQHPTYLQDTPDFLRHLQEINEDGILPGNTLAVTWDVIGLFTNIPHSEGLEAVRKARQKASLNGEPQQVPTEYIFRVLEIILENNIFEFNSELYRQEVGAAMGCKPIPGYANMFMAEIDKQILDLLKNVWEMSKHLKDSWMTYLPYGLEAQKNYTVFLKR